MLSHGPQLANGGAATVLSHGPQHANGGEATVLSHGPQHANGGKATLLSHGSQLGNGGIKGGAAGKGSTKSQGQAEAGSPSQRARRLATAAGVGRRACSPNSTRRTREACQSTVGATRTRRTLAEFDIEL